MPFFSKNPRLMGRLGSGPRAVCRLGSGVWASASFRIFALTAARGNVLGGEGNCSGGERSEGICPREKCPGVMSYTRGKWLFQYITFCRQNHTSLSVLFTRVVGL